MISENEMVLSKMLYEKNSQIVQLIQHIQKLEEQIKNAKDETPAVDPAEVV